MSCGGILFTIFIIYITVSAMRQKKTNYPYYDEEDYF